MSIVKQVTQVGNPLIRTKSKKVTSPQSKEVQKVITDLIDSMHHHQLVGMAAPQIGSNLRIFVSEIRATQLRKGKTVKDMDGLKVYINPKIISYSKKQVSGYEGCGSIASAGLFAVVKRPESIIVKAKDRNGNDFELRATNLLARVIQHEVDHINGIVFTDKADPKTYMSRNEYLDKFKK
jgi:peptide deformylase